MFYIARAPLQNMFWLYGMVAIQAIDLAGGLYYTGTGIVDIAHSVLPCLTPRSLSSSWPIAWGLKINPVKMLRGQRLNLCKKLRGLTGPRNI